MGKILSIRVMAQTLNEEDVANAWPGLCTIVWPEWMSSMHKEDKSVIRHMHPDMFSGAIEAALSKRKHGAAELAASLEDVLYFGKFSKNFKTALLAPTKLVSAASKTLSQALADWDVQKANKATDEIEEALYKAENAISSVPSAKA